MTAVAVTGHRPERLGESPAWILEALRSAFVMLGATTVLQGMAPGVDLMAAKVAYRLGVPFLAARPWSGHTPRKEDALEYERAMMFAHRIIDVVEINDFPGAWCYHERNRYLVDNCEVLVAVWDGKEGGGTHACLRYGLAKERPVFHINPLTGESKWLSTISPRHGSSVSI